MLRGITESGYQVLAAKHSPELIAAASPAQIISFANGAPRRLQVPAEVASTARSLGALQNLSLLLIDAHSKVLVVEDHSDEDYLKWWLEALLPKERWRRLAGRLNFLHGHRRPSPDQVNIMLDTIERTFARERNLQIRAFVFADRDYRLDAELRAENEKRAGKDFHRQRWHVWQRVEIENYLLSETAFLQGVAAKAGLAVDAPQVQAAFEEAVETNRERVRDQLMDAYGRYNREQKAGFEPSTLFHKAEADLLARWQGTFSAGEL